jgi:SAM-dependent methyltransferase
MGVSQPELNPPGQYADDRNLSARQLLWQHQDPFFDVVAWALELAELTPGMRVLDAGCGNGAYLRELAARPVRVVGCDLSLGMLRAAARPALVNADVTALPLRGGAVDVVLAAHMLYHVPDKQAAVREFRRVLAPGGTCVAVTNGNRQLLALRALTEQAVRRATPGWRMLRATDSFSAENGAAWMATGFQQVSCVRPRSRPPVVIRDAAIVTDYVASWSSFYHDQTARPWPEVADEVGRRVQDIIDREGAFLDYGDPVTFLCR